MGCRSEMPSLQPYDRVLVELGWLERLLAAWFKRPAAFRFSEACE